MCGPARAVRTAQAHGLDGCQDLGCSPCACMRPLHVCEAVFPQTWNTRTAWPKASTAPWTLGWTQSQYHTVSFSHLQHITLPKQCIMPYKTSYFHDKDSSPELKKNTIPKIQVSDYIGHLRLLGERTMPY